MSIVDKWLINLIVRHLKKDVRMGQTGDHNTLPCLGPNMLKVVNSLWLIDNIAKYIKRFHLYYWLSYFQELDLV